jgi:probable phosphoglycerate mutase
MGQTAKSRPVVFYIRHGETDWNVTGRLQGRHDVPLNARGRAQAMHCGEILRELFARDGRNAAELDFVSSPLGRARTTMELTRTPLGLAADGYRIEPKLAEIAFGDWEGFTIAQLHSRDPQRIAAREQDKWHFVPPAVKVIRQYPRECAKGTRDLPATRSLSRTAAPRAG